MLKPVQLTLAQSLRCYGWNNLKNRHVFNECQINNKTFDVYVNDIFLI